MNDHSEQTVLRCLDRKILRGYTAVRNDVTRNRHKKSFSRKNSESHEVGKTLNIDFRPNRTESRNYQTERVATLREGGAVRAPFWSGARLVKS